MSNYTEEIAKIRTLVSEQSKKEWQANAKQAMKNLERALPQESLAKFKAGTAITALNEGNLREFETALAAIEVALDQNL